MPDQKTIELIQQEVHTPNHAQIYEQKKKCEELDKELKAQAQPVRDNGLGLSKETQTKMVEFVKTNSKAKLLDIINKFYSK